MGTKATDRPEKSRLLWAILVVLGITTGFTLKGHADPYRDATAGHDQAIGLSYFGTHFHRLVLNPGEKFLKTNWPASDIGAIRLWDSGVWWAGISPKPGQWDFDRADAYVQYATGHHAEILYVLGGGTPRWASARPDERCPYGLGCAAEPVRMAYWEEYVRRVATRYQARVFAYELWNEPFFSELKSKKGESDFYYGPVAKMVEMAKVAREVLDEVNPKAILATPGFTGNTNQLELFLSSGGKQYVQAIAYHFYSANSEQFIREVLEVRAVMKRQGVEGLPLWNTETGIEVNPPGDNQPTAGTNRLTYPEAAARLAQFLVLGSAVGMEHFYHYAWDNERSGMQSRFGEPLPNLVAYEKVQAWLRGSKMLGCRKVQPSAVVCEGEHAGSRFAIAWSDIDGPCLLPAPTGWVTMSSEHLFDDSLKLYVSDSQDQADSFELGPRPMYIQYKPQPSAKAN